MRLSGFLEGLREGCLGGAGGAAVGADLRPAFAEEVAEFPAGLHRGSEQLFVGRLLFIFVLSETEQHFCEGPAGAEEGVGFACEFGALFHQAVAEGYVKV